MTLLVFSLPLGPNNNHLLLHLKKEASLAWLTMELHTACSQVAIAKTAGCLITMRIRNTPFSGHTQLSHVVGLKF